jgi:hypothetical protein
MTSADDRPLIEDPALPGAALVLSAAGLESLLADSLGPCSVELRRLRYKPGTSVVLGFDLTTTGPDGQRVTEPCVARAYADHAAAKITKTLERIPAVASLAHDPGIHVLVTTAAGDRALPLLSRLVAPDGRARALGRLLPEDPAPDRARIRTVRHNPGRRWVGVVEREGEGDLLLRAYPGAGRMVRAAAAYDTLGNAAAPTPHLVTKSRALAALTVAWAEGHTLALTSSEACWHSAGASLARLHDSRHVKLPSSPPSADTDAVEQTGGLIAQLLPELADEVLAITVATTRLLEQVPDRRDALHGDFSPDQVVVGPDGVPVLIDLDSARWGPAAVDLGCLAASTRTLAEALGEESRGERDVAALLDGYVGVRRPPDRFAVDVHAIAFRLRKAIDPFRACAPDWREQVGRRVIRTRGALDALTAAGLTR